MSNRFPESRIRPKPPRVCSLVLFRVGGRPLLAKMEEVGGVWPWPQVIPIPSQTPFITGIICHGDELFPVFDLADSLNLAVSGSTPFCLVARHRKGSMAVCIDENTPSLHTVEHSSIRPTPDANAGVIGTCLLGTEEVPVFSFDRIVH